MGDKEKAGAPAPRKPRERKLSLHNLIRPKSKSSEQPPPLPASSASTQSNKEQLRQSHRTVDAPVNVESQAHSAGPSDIDQSQMPQHRKDRRKSSVTSSTPSRSTRSISPQDERSFRASTKAEIADSGEHNASNTSTNDTNTSVSKPPPNSWLSRSSATPLGRHRSGSVGSNEASPQGKYLSRSSSSASNLGALEAASSPTTSSTRKRSNTWRRIVSGSSARHDLEQQESSQDPLMASTSQPPRSQKSSVLDAFRGIPDSERRTLQPADDRETLSPKQANRRSFLSYHPSPSSPSTPLSPEQPPKSSGRILRRISSKPLVSVNNATSGNKDAQTSNASQENLTSNTSTAEIDTIRTPRMGRRASNAMERALPGWLSGRDKGSTTPKESETSSAHTDSYTEDNVKPKLKPSSESLASRFSDRSGPVRNTLRRPSGALQVPASQQSSTDPEVEMLDEGGEAIPKRLSGWLLNMISSESPSNRVASTPDSLKAGSAQDSRSVAASVESTPLSQKTSASSLGQGGVPKGKGSNGILANFSSSARARAAAAASMGSAGIDKAMSYLAEDDQQDDIWLLGVKHSLNSATNNSTPLGPAIEVISPSPAKLSSSASRRSRRRHDNDTSPTRRSSSNVDADPTVRETTPSSISRSSTAESSSRISTASHRDSVSASPVLTADRKLEQCASPSNASSRSFDSRQSDKGSHRSQTSTPHRVTPVGLGDARQDDPKAQHSSTPLPSASDRQAAFQADFSSRVWCTYRNNFVPIARDGSISKAAEDQAAVIGSTLLTTESSNRTTEVEVKTAPQTPMGNQKGWLGRRLGDSSTNSTPGFQQHRSLSLGTALGVSPPAMPSPGTSLSEKMGIPNLWGRATAVVQATGLTGRSGLTTDAGWGCMLRTGQSLLANALLDVHLGRDWRRIPQPVANIQAPSDPDAFDEWRIRRARYATYVRILSWFFDEPSTACLFGVHRMAREGKRLGKEVGEWFGPSTAAGAIKKLIDDNEHVGLGVSVATDGVVYLSEVIQSATVLSSKDDRPQNRKLSSRHWKRPVLILIGIRLGLEGVNPMYYESVQKMFTFPQSVGIAGGRPSSSYYFVGYQGNSLFYLDPHNVRPAVPFRYPPFQDQKAFGKGDSSQQKHKPSDEDQDEWWANAYTESELATFHCDRPKRMPMRSLDPSMLLGFLVKDEESLADLTTRVKDLPKPIFAIQNEPPRWMRSDDDDFDESGEDNDPSLESFSEGSQADEGDDMDDLDDDEATSHTSGARAASDDFHTENIQTPSLSKSALTENESMSQHHSSEHISSAGHQSGSAMVPGIEISSASSRSLHVQHEFPRRRSRDTSSTARMKDHGNNLSQNRLSSSGSSVFSPTAPQFLRYHSDVRFPSTGSNATARQPSGSSTTRQASDSYVAVDEEDSDGDLVACHPESTSSSPESTTANSSASDPHLVEQDKEDSEDYLVGHQDTINSQVHGLAIEVPTNRSKNQSDNNAAFNESFASTSWEEVPAAGAGSPVAPCIYPSPTPQEPHQESITHISHSTSTNDTDTFSSSTSSSSSLYHSAPFSDSTNSDTGNIPRSNRINFTSINGHHHQQR
ncbi:unnamed protein product [Sympodiomycopsis kandeliae]